MRSQSAAWRRGLSARLEDQYVFARQPVEGRADERQGGRMVAVVRLGDAVDELRHAVAVPAGRRGGGQRQPRAARREAGPVRPRSVRPVVVFLVPCGGRPACRGDAP